MLYGAFAGVLEGYLPRVEFGFHGGERLQLLDVGVGNAVEAIDVDEEFVKRPAVEQQLQQARFLLLELVQAPGRIVAPLLLFGNLGRKLVDAHRVFLDVCFCLGNCGQRLVVLRRRAFDLLLEFVGHGVDVNIFRPSRAGCDDEGD